MTIKTKLTQREYVNASLTVITSRPLIRYFLVVFIGILLVNIVIGFTKEGGSVITILPMVIIPVIFCAVFYFSLKKAYSKNARISEMIAYSFQQNNFSMAGESFKAELSWSKIYKVSQTKNWLLIWQNRQIANVIPKKDLLAGDLDELKDILEANTVKNNL